MSGNHSKHSIQKELARIQTTVPQAMRDGLLLEEEESPAMVKVITEALKGDFPEEKKAEWRIALLRENPKKAALIDSWIRKEIKKSVKAGRLPTKKELKKLNVMYEK